MEKTLAQFHTARYNDDIQSVARLAKEYQKQDPSLTWAECIVLAESQIKVR